jgi:transposase
MKYDSIDAKTLAELTRADFLPESWVAPQDIQTLRAVIRERMYLVHTRSGLKIRLKAIIDARGHHSLRETCLQISKEKEVRALGDEEVNRLLDLIHAFDEHIAPLDNAIQKFAKKNKLAKLLMTIPTIGPISATVIVAEVGDFSRFKTAKQLASYAGLVPSQRSSAGVAKHGRITKQGSKYLRTTFVECAMRVRAKESDAPLYAFYERVKKASSPMKARVATARKLATLSWYIVTSQKPYNPLYSKDSTNGNDSVLFSGA